MPASAPKRMRRTDRRASLLAAAAQVVSDAPGERLSFEAVAEAAGVSSTLPYKYFDSIEDVTLELYAATVADVDARIDELLADPSVSFDDTLRLSFTMWCEQVERDDFLFVRLAEGANAADLARSVRRRRERAVGVWAQVLANEFGLDGVTARLLAASITTAASAMVQRVFADRLDRDAVAELLVVVARAQCVSAVASGTAISATPR
ncbi:MAG: TetR/AcrR family transcriptional regulator [Actinomycetota bacterium]